MKYFLLILLFIFLINCSKDSEDSGESLVVSLDSFLLISYPPEYTLPEPCATTLPHATGSPILPTCKLFANTVDEPDDKFEL